MKKMVFVFVFLSMIHTSHAFLIDNSLKDSLTIHNHCFTELEALKDFFTVTREQQGNNTVYSYYHDEYTGKKIKAYREASMNLTNKIFASNVGNGFIFGILIATITAFLKRETISSQMMIGGSTLAGIIALVLLQRQEIGNVPCFDYWSLEQEENLLGITATMGNIWFMIFGTSTGYFGTDYIITKLLNTSW